MATNLHILFKNHSGAKHKYTEYSIVRMIEFLIDNIFVESGGVIFQQVIGIPMRTNCSPLLADLFLYSYEAEFIQTLIKSGKRHLPKSFCFTYRYIDDVVSINNPKLGLVWFNPLQCFFDSEGHVALDRNPGPGYDTLLLRMISGDLLSAFPHRQFHTLPGLLDSWAALPNSNPNACVPMQGGSLHHFYDGLWYDPAERRTHDLPCERRTR